LATCPAKKIRGPAETGKTGDAGDGVVQPAHARTQLKPAGVLPDKRWERTVVYDAINNRMADPVYYLGWIPSEAHRR